MASGEWIWLAVAVVAGLLLGSFLNVCIARLPFHESVVRPGSRCPACLSPIRWYDNVPLLSFLLLRGRCRSCSRAIPLRYPLVELAVPLWFAFVLHQAWLVVQGTPQQGADGSLGVVLVCDALGTAILGWLLIGLIAMDWETQTLPDAFTLVGAAIGFLLLCVEAMFLPSGMGDIHMHGSLRMSSPGSMAERGDVFLTGPERLVLGRVLAIAVAACILLLVRASYKAFRGREGLGLGDVKMLAMIAAFLGFWPSMLALFVGVVACALVAVVLLARGKASATSQLPLGSFLGLGGLVAAAIGERLLAWYSGLL